MPMVENMLAACNGLKFKEDKYVCKYWNGHKWSEVTGNNTEMGRSPKVRLEMVPDVTTFPKSPKNELFIG